MATVTHAKVSAKADGGDATLVRPSDWNADHVIEGALPAGFVGAKAVRTTTLSPTADNTFRIVGFDTDEFDTDGFHDTSSNTERHTIPAGMGGKYLVLATLKQASDTATYVTLAIRKNGSTFIAGGKASAAHDNNGYKICEVSTVVDLAAADYLEYGYITNSSATLGDTSDTSGNTRLSFAIIKLDAGRVGSGVGAVVYKAASQTVSAATEETLLFDTETFDTDGFHSTSVNTGRMTIPSGMSGKYLLQASVYHGGTPGSSYAYIRKNGSTAVDGSEDDNSASPHNLHPQAIVDAAAGDYFEVRSYRSSGTTSGNGTGGAANSFSIVRIDSNASGVLASGKATNSFFTTTNSSPTLVTGLSITITTGARRCLVGFAGNGRAGYNGTGGFEEAWFYMDGASIGTGFYAIVAGNQYWNMSGSVLTDVLSAGSHTFEYRIAANGGGTHSVEDNGRFWVQELPDSGALASGGTFRTWDTATVNTQQGTSSTSYADLATVGPAVTIDVPASGAVRLSFSAEVENNTATQRTYIGFAISGATTTAAADATGAVMRQDTSGDPITIGRSLILEGLTPGSTTFTMKYRVGGGTGDYLNRQINVETLT